MFKSAVRASMLHAKRISEPSRSTNKSTFDTKSTPTILLTKEQRHERARNMAYRAKQDNKKYRSLKLIHNRETLGNMNIKTQFMVERMQRKFHTLSKEIVRNVVAYAKSLPRYGSDIIDRCIFEAEMKRHFDLTDRMLLERMFHVCCLNAADCKVSIEEFSELICIFLEEHKEHKILFTFRVYNARGDGFLTKNDLIYFIKPMVATVGTPDDNEETTYKDFVEMLLNVVDRDGDNQVDISEFRLLAKQDVLMMQCLGECLPSEDDRYKFIDRISGKSFSEVSELFRYERRIALRCAPLKLDKGVIQKYYPLPLEMP